MCLTFNDSFWGDGHLNVVKRLAQSFIYSFICLPFSTLRCRWVPHCGIMISDKRSSKKACTPVARTSIRELLSASAQEVSVKGYMGDFSAGYKICSLWRLQGLVRECNSPGVRLWQAMRKFVQCVKGRKKGKVDRNISFCCRLILEENSKIWEKQKHAIQKAKSSLIQPILMC